MVLEGRFAQLNGGLEMFSSGRVPRGCRAVGLASLLGSSLVGCALGLGPGALDRMDAAGGIVVTRVQDVEFSGPPSISELSAAWMLGGETEPGPYALRVRLARGGRIPPHTHPDARHTVVLEGTLWVGTGARFDPERLIAVPAGAVLWVPARVPHYVWAKDGDVEYQENGQGPTATRFVPSDSR